jgi:hypothetical protein
MKKNYFMKQTIIATVLLTAAGTVNAGLSFVSTGTETRTQTFDIAGFTTLGVGTTLEVGHLDFTGTGSQMVTYTFLGQESWFNNKFYDVSGGTMLLESDPVGTSISSLVSTLGPLSFMFEGRVGKFAINDGAWDRGTSIGLIGTDMTIGSTTYAYVLGYNDSAGKRHRGDWDDFVIGVSPIPEPETYAMLLVGLGLVSFALRRRKEFMLIMDEI